MIFTQKFRFVDEDGQDYQPPYFPPPQFEQQGQYQFHTQATNGDGQYTQQVHFFLFIFDLALIISILYIWFSL